MSTKDIKQGNNMKNKAENGTSAHASATLAVTKNKLKKGTVPEIVQVGDPVLHTPAKEVEVTEINSSHIKKVIEDMKKALDSQEDGVGLAAPQIGVPLRIFIVAGFVFDRINASKLEKATKKDQGPEIAKSEYKEKVKKIKSPHQIFINPIITKESKEKKWMEGEGCLSVRWYYGKVRRSTKVSLKAYDESGKLSERGASGLLAHIFQHEVDHLDGILFIDKAKDIEEFDPEEIKNEIRRKKRREEFENE